MPRIASLVCCLLCWACTADIAPVPAQAAPPGRAPPDLSGHWELDYGRSDNLDMKLQALYDDAKRAASRRAALERNRSQMGSLNLDDSRALRRQLAAARFADMITASQTLEIEQTQRDIEIRRENSFPLTCVFEAGGPEVPLAEHGEERCGWAADGLRFVLQLPDNLGIGHLVSPSPDGKSLRIATTVNSGSAPPFTMQRIYRKFTALPQNYSCEYTLSRGNVCQRSGR